MKIGIVGGTGNMGRGLTIRWAANHDILIGSRSLERARWIAKKLEKTAKGFYQVEMQESVNGTLNAAAVKRSEVAVITLPRARDVCRLVYRIEGEQLLPGKCSVCK